MSAYANSGLLHRALERDGIQVKTAAQKGDAHGIDWWLAGMCLLLMALGVLMVFSASGYVGEHMKGDTLYFFKRQAVFAVFAMAVMFAAAYLPRKLLNRLHYPALLGVIALLVLTVFIGSKVNFARRWIAVGPISIQPMEFAKVALVLYLAYFMSTKQALIRTFSRGVIPPFAITGLLCGLLLLQPDFGGAVLLALLLFFMCYVGGTRLIYLIISGGLAASLAWSLVVSTPYRFRRWMAFLDPFADPLDTGYQLVQSLYAMALGGITGSGLGASRQKLLFLPEAHTDFIMSVFGEEVGFIGFTLLFILLGVMFWRCLRIALRQPELRDRLCAFGIMLIPLLGVTLNLAVVMAQVPSKGIAMPFFSYGGSSLVTTMLCMGLLLNYSRTMRRDGGEE